MVSLFAFVNHKQKNPGRMSEAFCKRRAVSIALTGLKHPYLSPSRKPEKQKPPSFPGGNWLNQRSPLRVHIRLT